MEFLCRLSHVDESRRAATRTRVARTFQWPALARTGSPWRLMPHDLPPWHAVYQQTRRWVRAGCFETLAEDLRVLLRLAAHRNAAPSAVILDSRTVQATR